MNCTLMLGGETISIEAMLSLRSFAKVILASHKEAEQHPMMVCKAKGGLIRTHLQMPCVFPCSSWRNPIKVGGIDGG